MSLTNYGENKLLDLLRVSGTFYVGLFTSAPSENGGGTEISAGGYARQKVTFGAASDGRMSNSVALEYPTATVDWGTAVGWGLFDAATGGNMVWYGEITTPKTLYAGDIYRMHVGSFALALD